MEKPQPETVNFDCSLPATNPAMGQPVYGQQYAQPGYGVQQPQGQYGQPVPYPMYVQPQHPQPLMMAPGLTFSSPLCDCMKDIPSCVDAFFCPWCTVASQHDMLAFNRVHMNPLVCGMTLLLDMTITYGIAVSFMTAITRGHVRERYGLQGDVFTDCVVSFCCNPCTVSQMTREMALRGQWPGGVCANRPPMLQMQ